MCRVSKFHVKICQSLRTEIFICYGCKSLETKLLQAKNTAWVFIVHRFDIIKKKKGIYEKKKSFLMVSTYIDIRIK